MTWLRGGADRDRRVARLNVVVGRRNGGARIAARKPLTWGLGSSVVMGLLAVAVYYFERSDPDSSGASPDATAAHVRVRRSSA
jgi:hypothetical protein